MYEVPYSKHYLNCWVCGYCSSADEHCGILDMTPCTFVDWYIGTKVLNELAVAVFGGIREDALALKMEAPIHLSARRRIKSNPESLCAQLYAD